MGTGRGEATCKRGGVRMGTAECYGIVEALPEVADSPVVHLEDEAGGPGELLLFVVLRPGFAASDALAREIQDFVKVKLAAHEYPRIVAFADSLPMTATGKVLRRELRALG